MLWQGRRQSSNVEDRRGIGAGGLAVGGGVIGVIAIIINLLMGGDPSQIPEMLPQQQSQPMSPEQQAADEERAQFVKVVLAETEDVWNNIFQKQGSSSKNQRLFYSEILFSLDVEMQVPHQGLSIVRPTRSYT